MSTTADRLLRKYSGDCCSHTDSDVPAQGARGTIALIGNPNVGKSVLFGALTGSYAEVSNYPGTTVGVMVGRFDDWRLVDTPGCYSIGAFSDDERVTRDVLLGAADVVVNVVDAVHLERDLFLTQHLIDAGAPVVVALNMLEEAQKRGIEIDVQGLSRALGVPVVPVYPFRKGGVEKLGKALRRAGKGNKVPYVERLLAEQGVHDGDGAQDWRAVTRTLLWLEGDAEAAAQLGREVLERRDAIYTARRDHVQGIARRVMWQRQTGRRSWRERFEEWLITPLPGLLTLAAFLGLLYLLIGVFVAQTVVGFTEDTLMGEWIGPRIEALFALFLNPDGFVYDLLAGEFGVVTMTLSYIFGLILPLVVAFYLTMSFIEDTGYLPRIAVLTDRVMSRMGLNGQAIIPMILGLGCTTMAIMTTRILGTRRERWIATFLLCLAIPCSAQLGVTAVLLLPLGAGTTLLYVGVLVAVFFLAGLLLNKVWPGRSSGLLLDLPPLRRPHLGNLLRKTWLKTRHFLSEAGPIFAVGAVVLTVMTWTGLMDGLARLAGPVTSGWLQLPAESARAFVMGLMRRDFGVAGLYDLPLTPVQTVVAAVTMTLFVPCIASLLMIMKERGKAAGFAMAVSVIGVAIVVGGIFARLLGLWL